jgi:hypothetical protein
MTRSRTSSRSRRPSAPRSPPNSLKSGRQPIGKHREKLALVDTQAGRPSELAVVRDCVRLRLTAVDGRVREPPPEPAYTRPTFHRHWTGVRSRKVEIQAASNARKTIGVGSTFRSNALMRFQVIAMATLPIPGLLAEFGGSRLAGGGLGRAAQPLPGSSSPPGRPIAGCHPPSQRDLQSSGDTE